MPKQDMPTIEDFIGDQVPVSPDGYFVGHLQTGYFTGHLRNMYQDYCKL